MADLIENLAEPWKPNSVIYEEKYYTYNEKLYLCKVEHESIDEFFPDNFTEVSLANIFAGIETNGNSQQAVLLWTNSNNYMTNGTTIPASLLKDYDAVIVHGEARTDYPNGGSYAYIDIHKANNGNVCFTYGSGGGGNRSFTVNSDKSITFGSGYFNYGDSQNYGVPLKIYGLKGNIIF